MKRAVHLDERYLAVAPQEYAGSRALRDERHRTHTDSVPPVLSDELHTLLQRGTRREGAAIE